jgi:hypothetical protein
VLYTAGPAVFGHDARLAQLTPGQLGAAMRREIDEPVGATGVDGYDARVAALARDHGIQPLADVDAAVREQSPRQVPEPEGHEAARAQLVALWTQAFRERVHGAPGPAARAFVARAFVEEPQLRAALSKVRPEDFAHLAVADLAAFAAFHPEVRTAFERIHDRALRRDVLDFVDVVRAAVLHHAVAPEPEPVSPEGLSSRRDLWAVVMLRPDGSPAPAEPWLLAALDDALAELVPAAEQPDVGTQLREEQTFVLESIFGLRRAVEARTRIPGLPRLLFVGVQSVERDGRRRVYVDPGLALPPQVREWLRRPAADVEPAPANVTAALEAMVAPLRSGPVLDLRRRTLDRIGLLLDRAEAELLPYPASGHRLLRQAVRELDALHHHVADAQREQLLALRFRAATLQRRHPPHHDAWVAAFREAAAVLTDLLADDVETGATTAGGVWSVEQLARRLGADPGAVRDAAFVAEHLDLDLGPHRSELVSSALGRTVAAGFRPTLRGGLFAVALEVDDVPVVYLQGRHRKAHFLEGRGRLAMVVPPRGVPLPEFAAAVREGHLQIPTAGLGFARLPHDKRMSWRFVTWNAEIDTVTSVPRISTDPDPDGFQRTERSVVVVRQLPRGDREGAQGSAFVIAHDVVATAAHVVRGAHVDDLRVAGRRVAAVLGHDPALDLTFLLVPGLDLPVVPLRTTPLELEADVSPSGHPQNVRASTVGRISGIEGDYVLVDVDVAGGHSGGLLRDVHGAGVGITLQRYIGKTRSKYLSSILIEARRPAVVDTVVDLPARVVGVVADAPGVTVPLVAVLDHLERVEPRVLVTEWYLRRLAAESPELQLRPDGIQLATPARSGRGGMAAVVGLAGTALVIPSLTGRGATAEASTSIAVPADGTRPAPPPPGSAVASVLPTVLVVAAALAVLALWLGSRWRRPGPAVSALLLDSSGPDRTGAVDRRSTRELLAPHHATTDPVAE